MSRAVYLATLPARLVVAIVAMLLALLWAIVSPAFRRDLRRL